MAQYEFFNTESIECFIHDPAFSLLIDLAPPPPSFPYASCLTSVFLCVAGKGDYSTLDTGGRGRGGATSYDGEEA